MAQSALSLPPPGAPILSVRGVSKSYGSVEAVRDVSLEIPRGSIYGFLGPNGAGKSTTIRITMGILLPDRGEVTFAGRPLDGAGRDRIGYLPEERGLYRKMKCAEQLAFFAELKGVPRREALARAAQWMDRMGLGEWSGRKVDELSKGMQQKVQFAATFLFDPDVVILDEPFSGLDPLNIELLREIILEQRARGRTIIFSTHMLAEAEKICDHVCLIDGGEKILDGTLDAVRGQFPQKSVRVAYEGGGEPPSDLPGVALRQFDEGSWRLLLDPDVDPQPLLDRLRAAGRISLFTANRPTLGEIFLAAVTGRRATAGAAATGGGVR